MTMKRTYLLLTIAALLAALLSGQILAEADRSASPPESQEGRLKPTTIQPPFLEVCTHTYSNFLFSVSNFGLFGSEDGEWRDCETGLSAPSAQFPAGSRVEYLYAAALWIGAVVGEDTLVSTGFDGWQYVYEMNPCSDPTTCGLHKRSNRPADPYYDQEAHADLEFSATYTDTLADSRYTGVGWNGEMHNPLNIEVSQTSYSWSVGYAQDFILLDYKIRNIGPKTLENVYIGLYVDGDVNHVTNDVGGHEDDICGFRETYQSIAGREFLDTIDFAWIADNDGDPSNGIFDVHSATSVAGVRVMRLTSTPVKVAFNWWTSNGTAAFDWGPMMDATRRNYGTGGLGTPEGDRNKYYLLSNGEHDYDQFLSAIEKMREGWLPPATFADAIADGYDTRFVLSAGPFDIDVGDSIPFTLGYVAGEDFHRDPANLVRNLPGDPAAYYSNLDFRDAALNAVWAYWVYDNPGFDTDNDGNAGSYWLIPDTVAGEVILDTFYYAGDGVPDFRAAVSPPPPVIRFSTELGKVKLHWNGLASETTKDPFTRQVDFEGYRVYVGRLPRIDRLGLLESRDRLDYTMLSWNSDKGEFEVISIPLTLAELRDRFGSSFNPEEYPLNDEGTGFDHNGSTLCFAPLEWNQSIAGWQDGSRLHSLTGIKKTYAEEIDEGLLTSEIDSLNPDLWVKGLDPLRGDSVFYHKFYEYEFEIDDLLSSVPWYFSVTAFDFGDYERDLEPLESSPIANVVEVWAINDASVSLREEIAVQVFPNPYYGDGRYVASGYEDRWKTGFVDHERRIHFVNLPPRCTLRIYTLSGELVRQIDHPGEFSDTDSKVEWDMRTRHNELVASGIYLFSVESEWGNQVGKFVIIL